MHLILAIDQGTTGTTTLTVDRSGRAIHRGYAELRQHYPQPGWVEHSPDAIWQTVETAVRQMQGAGFCSSQVEAIGITNQRETSVAWDRETGQALGRAIVWQCRRTAPTCERWSPRAAMFRQRTGLVLDPYFSATKWHWMLEHRDEVARATERDVLALGTVDSWLLWKLSGGQVHATDHTNASRTLLFDIHQLRWDPELTAVAHVPLDALPSAHPSVHLFGKTAGLDFLPDGIPIMGIAGDQQAALFGQRCVSPGMTKNTYGTGCFLMAHTGGVAVTSEHGLLTTLACSTDDTPQYALEGSVFVAGAAVQWMRDELGLVSETTEIEALAGQVEDSGGVVLVPAFTGLGAPHWAPDARGAIFGLTRGTGPAHLARAALEAIAHQSADVAEAMQSDAGSPLKELRVDGGASANNLLMQLQADLLDCPVNRPRNIETTAMGAAFLAGLASGFWTSEQLDGCRQVDARFYPAMPGAIRSQKRAAWKAAVQRIL